MKNRIKELLEVVKEKTGYFESPKDAYEFLLAKDKITYGDCFEKVTFDENTGTLTRQRVRPEDILKPLEKEEK
jgi:hypothetical protein